MLDLQLAQTHVLPDGKLSWSAPTPPNASETLHLVGSRDTLALVRLGATDAVAPAIEAMLGDQSLGTMPLDPPAALPPTEANGPAYAADLYSATLPASWLKPGLALRVKASNYSAGTARAVVVGADMAFSVRMLPIYLFGANEANTQRPLASIASLPADAQTEALAKWPITRLEASIHPARMVQWPELAIMPRADGSGTPQPAYVARSASDYRDGGFGAMYTLIDIVQALRKANGDGPMSVHYYAPIIALDAAGNYRGTGGGVGGSSVGVGDDAYAGIFIHEQGHAFGLPHAGEAYDKGNYPYAWGSLNGSAWGYDTGRREFLAPFVPSSARSYAGCSANNYGGHLRALDAAGRCVKQDPMQSGDGDQAAGYRFATFSDYDTAIIQRYFEGATTLDSKGAHVPSSRLFADAAFASGYREWDTLDKRWVNAKVATVQNGMYGLDRGLPQQKDVPVYAIALAVSNAGT
ncbi:MAG: peptidase M66, partial [Proteobacteria bacterium]|nr:peptidase M66 [Pseudomonadota bacterium]